MRSRGAVLGEAVFDGVAAERPAAAGGKERVDRSAGSFGSVATVPAIRGVIRFLRPLPRQLTCGPLPRWSHR